jgi:hypothetical protein
MIIFGIEKLSGDIVAPKSPENTEQQLGLSEAKLQECRAHAASAIVAAATTYPKVVIEGLEKCGSTFISSVLSNLPKGE